MRTIAARANITLVVVGLAAGACSSNDTTSPDTGNASTPGSTVTPSPSGSNDCEGVIAARERADVLDYKALATDGKDVFVLSWTSNDGGTNVIRKVANGQLGEVARIHSDLDPGLWTHGLEVDADAFYVDAVIEDEHALYRVPRAGGEPQKLAPMMRSQSLTPPFVVDAEYVYFVAGGYETLLSRVPLTGGTPQVLGGRNDSPWGALTIDDTNLYISTSGEIATLEIVPKVPAPIERPRTSSYSYKLSPCNGYGSGVQVDGDEVFLGCGGTEVSIAHVSTTTTGLNQPFTSLLTGKYGLDARNFIVREGNIYFVEDNALLRMPIAGGSRTKLLATRGVTQMITDGQNLFVASQCGVQKTSL